MKKILPKLIALCLAVLFGGTASVFLSSVIHFQLKQIKVTMELLAPSNCIQSIASDRQHLTLFLCLWGVTLLLAILIMASNVGKKYESDMRQITPKIKTPVAAGQCQHGSARWLSKSQIKEAFDTVKMNYRNTHMKELISKGYDKVTTKSKANQKQKKNKWFKIPRKDSRKKLSKSELAKKAAARKKADSKRKKEKANKSGNAISIVSKKWSGKI
jgi:hypothetical protein